MELIMGRIVDPNTLHRTAKYFMDNGRAHSIEDAMAILNGFGLTIYVGSEIADSVHQQNALITLVNVAGRTLLGGIEVVGLPDVQSLTPIALDLSLRESVRRLGGRTVLAAKIDWPAAVIGDFTGLTLPSRCWRLTWSGWRGGVIPVRDGRRLQEQETIQLAPLLAAAVCAAEAFAYHAGDNPMAGRRASGLSLWRPGSDWLVKDATEPVLTYLPARLWLIGLGNLGQAFAWALASLPYPDRGSIQLILQDFDRLAVSNESTSLLSFATDIGRRKARTVAEWFEARGFEAFVNERHFGPWTRRGDDEPGVALCGVDNPIARAALEHSGFGLVVEAGLGAGPEAFRSLSVHTFPASRSAEEIWSRQVGQPGDNFEHMPAYQSLARNGMDSCGLAQLASRTVGVPFVGLTAACLVVSELLRRLNGGPAFEIMSCSVAALEDIETVAIPSGPYAFGHVTIEQ
jgi:hypothetical protein